MVIRARRARKAESTGPYGPASAVLADIPRSRKRQTLPKRRSRLTVRVVTCCTRANDIQVVHDDVAGTRCVSLLLPRCQVTSASSSRPKSRGGERSSFRSSRPPKDYRAGWTKPTCNRRWARRFGCGCAMAWRSGPSWPSIRHSTSAGPGIGKRTRSDRPSVVAFDLIDHAERTHLTRSPGRAPIARTARHPRRALALLVRTAPRTSPAGRERSGRLIAT